MNTIEKEINKGIFYMTLFNDVLNRGNQQTSSNILYVVRRIINDYPKQTTELKKKYQEAKVLYEEKFGGLELGVQEDG